MLVGHNDKAIQEERKMIMAETVQQILDRARYARKHDWREYEFYKSQISFAARSNLEYEDGIRRLCLILEL